MRDHSAFLSEVGVFDLELHGVAGEMLVWARCVSGSGILDL